ncbi:tRNA modification GTPase MnmE [Bienertia sinuspersici]
MAARIMAAARQAASINRISSQPPLTQLVHRRGLAGSAGHGPPKVDCWKEPMNPGNWKEEHFVIVSLSGWGLLIFGGFKLFSGGKGKTERMNFIMKPSILLHK